MPQFRGVPTNEWTCPSWRHHDCNYDHDRSQESESSSLLVMFVHTLISRDIYLRDMGGKVITAEEVIYVVDSSFCVSVFYVFLSTPVEALQLCVRDCQVIKHFFSYLSFPQHIHITLRTMNNLSRIVGFIF